MGVIHTATGRLVDDRTITLDEPLPATTSEVLVRVRAAPGEDIEGSLRVLDQIRAEQRARGHVPRSREEIDAQIEEERNSWDR